MDAVGTDVDLDGDGRQHGWLTSARGRTTFDRPRVPLTVLRRGDGPCILLLGGEHGDGSGSLALRRLARELDDATLAGAVVIVPDAPPALIGPIVRDLGDAFDTVLELADAPAGLGFSPMIGLASGGKDDVRARAEAAMVAFGAPESVRFAPELVPGSLADSPTPGTAHVVAMLDGGVPLAEALDIALVGCRNVLAAVGVLDAPLTLRATRTLAVRDAGACLHAPTNGLLELRARPGQAVYGGNPLALVIDPTRNGTEPVFVRVPRDGIVLAARTGARVSCGDCIAIVAEEMPR